MGMFDYVRCGVKLDDCVDVNTVYQTKDLDCCLDDYWIDPSGQIWVADTSGTYDFLEHTDEELAQARERREWLSPFEPVPNGNHGKLRALDLTRSIRIYPDRWLCRHADYSDWPEFTLVFRDGKLILSQSNVKSY